MFLDRIAVRVMGTTDYAKLFLWIPRLLMQNLCLWPRQKNVTYKRPILFYTAMVLYNFLQMGLIFHTSDVLDDLVKLASHVTFITVTFQAIAKMMVMYIHNKELERLVDDLMFKFWPYDLLDNELKSELKTFYYAIVFIMLFLMSFGTTYTMAIMATSLFTHTLPFDVSYPYIDWSSFPYYQIIFLLQYVTIQCLMYCTTLGCDYIFLAICSAVISQFKLLQNALLAFNTPEMYKINEKLRQIGTDELRIRKYNIHREYFVRCVDHHHMLLLFIGKLNEIFSSIEVVQLICSMTGICIGLLTLTSLEDPPISTLIILLAFTAIYFNELFIFCSIGNELHYQASFLPEYIFRSNWETCGDNELTKDFMFMLQRSQDIPEINAYNIYNNNMDSYIKVVRLSFSIYTFLTTMKDKHK